MLAKQRYEGLQTLFLTAHNWACLFLCMLSIAEEYTGHEIDFIEAYHACRKNGSLGADFYCNDQEKILQSLTGKKWRKVIMKKLPEPVPSAMYTVEHWYNSKTKYDHYKRRGYDTVTNSVTVRDGKLLEYYTYTVEA